MADGVVSAGTMADAAAVVSLTRSHAVNFHDLFGPVLRHLLREGAVEQAHDLSDS